MSAEDIGMGQDMHDDQVLAAIAEVVSSTARVEAARVTPDARLEEDLGIDSLTLVDLVVAAEDRFGLVIADDDWSRFRTVGDIAAHLDQVSTLPR
jgi:acyl carrier protein